MKNSGFPVEKSLALLIDPDKAPDSSLENLLSLAEENQIDYIFTGGSITFNGIDQLIFRIKNRTSLPVVLFPGNLLQLSRQADRILLLSLISGRNPELLIGNHVLAAPFLKDLKEKVTSVGYILINCGGRTSVEYMSQTESIPCDKPEIAVATAIAGELLGMQMIYLEGGSGTGKPVPRETISEVIKNVSIPVAVGGGLRNAADIRTAFESGASLVILGNSCEENPLLLREAASIRDSFRKLPESTS
ncbi:MAG TPA: geranylgeranylglyceryl/heptaprenylglyceryl phosphate synthase [Bacteroidales bacterium]|nr:geranylgeranylglyceryl/heptaprenylglyceryl phosphate synthase [Bacteroidales bacterium]